MARTNTLALHEQLRQVLRVSIGHGPFPVLHAEGWLLLLSLISVSGGLWLCLFSFLANRLLLYLNDLRLSELFILNFSLFDVLFFGLELKTDNSLDFTDMLLNHEQLVHKPKLQAILFSNETSRVAQPFEKNKALVWSSLKGDCVADELNYQVEIEVSS